MAGSTYLRGGIEPPSAARRYASPSAALREPVAGGFDQPVILLVSTLLTLGVVMVYSASVTVAGGAEFDWHTWWRSPLRQGLFALGGLITMLMAAALDYRVFRSGGRFGLAPAATLYGIAALLLAAMLLGLGSGEGVQRAIVLSRGAVPLSFQPAEIAKVALAIWMAALLTDPRIDLRSFRRGYLPALVSAGLLIGLVGIDDFGTAALMGVVTGLVLVVAGARWTHLGLTALLGAAMGAVLVLSKEYRIQRLVTFFSDQADPAREGYQVTQSLIAIGSGGWLGRGLGAGVQKYDYLPQDNNDFILAILCEELGVVTGVIVALLFVALLLRGWWIARGAEPFGRLLAIFITATICLQAAFNVAVVTNSIPTKGISLPFVSAGGSGVLLLGAAAGLLASVGRSRALGQSRAGMGIAAGQGAIAPGQAVIAAGQSPAWRRG